MCWRVAPLIMGCGVPVCGPRMVRRVVVAGGPLDGGARCAGVWHPSSWGVSWWYVAPLEVGLCCVVWCRVALRCVVCGCGV